MKPVDNLADAIITTLESKGINALDRDLTKRNTLVVLDYLMHDKKYTSITRTNGAREYVVNTPEYLLIEEMKKKCGKAYLDNNLLFPAYADYVVYYAKEKYSHKEVEPVFEEEQPDNAYPTMFDRIDSLNLNNNQKEFLKECFLAGDYEELKSYKITEEEIRKYIEKEQESPTYGSR